MKLLIYGYGNPGRCDDGLGVFFAEEVERLNMSNVTVDTNYQLNAEDALLAADFDIVVFVDASKNDIPGYRLCSLTPAIEIEFTTHAMSPASVIGLCEQLYSKKPASYILEIKGYEWTIEEGLTDDARQNAAKALAFLKPLLEKPSLDAFESAASND